MAAPTAGARSTPVGIYLEEGYQVLVAFASNPTIALWEKQVTPPGLENGDPINITTQWSIDRRQKAARALNEATDGSFTCAYDPAVYAQVEAIMGEPTTVTIHYPDGSTYAFFGYLKDFKPGGMTEGGFPEATCTIVETDMDPVNHVQANGVLVSAPGT